MEEFKDEQVERNICVAFVLTLTIICTFNKRSETKQWKRHMQATAKYYQTKVLQEDGSVKGTSQGAIKIVNVSTNPKVVSIDAKGKLKLLRLGVTTITVKSGRKENYTNHGCCENLIRN